MIQTIDDLARGARALPPDQRFALVRSILASVDSEGASGADEVWAAEIRERIERYDAGETMAIPAEEVFILKKKIRKAEKQENPLNCRT